MSALVSCHALLLFFEYQYKIVMGREDRWKMGLGSGFRNIEHGRPRRRGGELTGHGWMQGCKIDKEKAQFDTIFCL